MTLQQRIAKELAAIRRESDKSVDKALAAIEAEETKEVTPIRYWNPQHRILPRQTMSKAKARALISPASSEATKTGYCTCWVEKEVDGVIVRVRRVIIDNGKKFNPTCGWCLEKQACAVPMPQKRRSYE